MSCAGGLGRSLRRKAPGGRSEMPCLATWLAVHAPEPRFRLRGNEKPSVSGRQPRRLPRIDATAARFSTTNSARKRAALEASPLGWYCSFDWRAFMMSTRVRGHKAAPSLASFPDTTSGSQRHLDWRGNRRSCNNRRGSRARTSRVLKFTPATVRVDFTTRFPPHHAGGRIAGCGSKQNRLAARVVAYGSICAKAREAFAVGVNRVECEREPSIPHRRLRAGALKRAA